MNSGLNPSTVRESCYPIRVGARVGVLVRARVRVSLGARVGIRVRVRVRVGVRGRRQRFGKVTPESLPLNLSLT